MQQRYYSVDPVAYEQTRLWLDVEWGHGPGKATETCVHPLAIAPRNAAGRVMLQVWDVFLGYDAVAAVLPSLIASGKVVEITRDEYWSAMPKGMP